MILAIPNIARNLHANTGRHPLERNESSDILFVLSTDDSAPIKIVFVSSNVTGYFFGDNSTLFLTQYLAQVNTSKVNLQKFLFFETRAHLWCYDDEFYDDSS